ncbi:hydroxyneurosporene methyltransferase [Mycobacterium florentinum]|uniref:Hydroxyneurosporene methyltransferase n=1 Tax=Mycobacterium florentinum TaxID=292462 RepID=A0A1X1UEW3_MYCFL|nr:methyltransferase [Mycobacterium florentinum]MCV7411581.1 hydroxyneurosporene methyltransferase [Mycobacterium florentinum]ORV55373.1 hydroxyneurosporene methyltransferase [Mycobacterium florentinum]BBX80943.1 hydroxyneurosporene-O-methyltransferase [Mycobacterium florentinum]
MLSPTLPPARFARAIEFVRHQVGQLHQRMAPPPAAMMEMITNAWAAQAITAAADLGIADVLAKGPLSVDEVAEAVDADADTIGRLLRALSSRGIFRLRRDGRYDLTPIAETLRSDSDVSLRAFARFVGSPQDREHWSHFTDSIRTGRPVIPELRGKPCFEYLAEVPELDEVFNQAMTDLSELEIPPVVAGYDFSRFGTIVDIAGGRGRLLAAILNATPKARGILFDQPHVVAGASSLLEEHGVADRVKLVEGSFFESVADGGDAYLLKHIIHDWPDDEAVQILSNIRKAAGVGKQVLILEFVIPRHEREFPGHWMDLEMHVAAGARERTAGQYGRLLSRAGFRLTRVVETASPLSIVEAVAV